MVHKTPGWDDARFVERCRIAAARKGWTLTELCLQAGIAKDYLGHIPKHGRNLNSIIKLAKTLEVSPGWLMGFEDSGDRLMVSASDLATLSLVSTVAAHLFVAMQPPPGNGARHSVDEIVQAVMETVSSVVRRQRRQEEAAPTDTKSEEPEAPHPLRRTSRRRSSAL